MRYYRLYATGGSTAANAANVQIVRAGTIKSVRWACSYDCATDNSACRAELSLQPVSVEGVNDSRGPIDKNEWLANGTTPLGFVNEQVLTDVPVGQGERLYLNLQIAGTVTAYINVIVGVEE